MTKNTKTTVRICIFALAILWMGFIIYNSLQSGAESGQASAGVTELVNKVLSTIGIKQTLSESFIRNMAHFTEFGVLSVLVCLNVLLTEKFPKSSLPKSCGVLALSVPFCALFALLDEFVQKFSAGRASDILDVLTDTCGALVAAVAFVLTYCAFVVINRHKKL